MTKKIRKEITVGIEKTNYPTWAGILILPAMGILLFFAVLYAWSISPPELNVVQAFMLGTGMGMGIMLFMLIAYVFYTEAKGWGDLKKKVWKTMTVLEEK